LGVEPWVSDLPLTTVYPKALPLNRFIAKLVDIIIVAAADKLVPPIGWLGGLAYVLIADGFSGGRSIGKRLIGLQTVVRPTHEIAGFKESILRNLPLAVGYLLYPLPYIGWLVAFAITGLEALLILGNDQGLRLGDEIAQTQVLDAGQFEFRE
jgi:RDD family